MKKIEQLFAAQENAGKSAKRGQAVLDPVLAEALAAALAAPDSLVSDVVSWHGHIPFAQALIAITKPQLVVELGVHKGDSYRALTDAMARHKVEGRAFGVDTWQGDEHSGIYASEATLREVQTRNKPYRAFSTLLQKTFDEAVGDFDHGSIDLLHIDGLHTYEAVRHDFESWRPKLSPRAIVLFHDTAVKRGDFGVYRFWEEISSECLSHQFDHSHGLGVLCFGDEIDARTSRLMRLLTQKPDGGIAPARLFDAIGIAYAARVSKRIGAAKEEEIKAVQSASMAEIERLNAEIATMREQGQAALDVLDAEWGERVKVRDETLAETQSALGEARRMNVAKEEEIKAVQSASMAEIERLNAEIVTMREQGQAALDALDAEWGERVKVRDETLAETQSALGEARRMNVAKEEEIKAVQSASMAEIERLNAEIATMREQGQAALDALDAEWGERVKVRDQTLAETQSALGEVRAGWADANEELLRLRRWTIPGITERAIRVGRGAAKRAIRVGGRTVLGLLPVEAEMRTRLKYHLTARYGHWAGLQPNQRYNAVPGKEQVITLRAVSDRYRTIARAATGAPAQIPPRRVSIIIPVHNQIEFTLRCLESIELNTGDVEHEIIVVDDCSTDNTRAALSKRKDVISIRNERNLGFIGSCNVGLTRASMDYVLFLNNDTEVGPNWLSALVDTFELNANVGLVGSKLIYPDGRLQEAGGIIWNDFSGWNFGRMQDPEEPRFNYVRRADYCSGASLMLPRAMAVALGGFDPEFAPAYGEDSDLAFKIRLMGLSVLYQPLSQVIHHEGVSSGTDVTQGVKAYQLVNAAKLLDRWEPVLEHHSPNGENPDIAADRSYLGRVLVIDQITPEPDRDAGSITSLEMMTALRDLGYKITFIPCSNFTYIPDYSDTLAALGIESVLYPWAQSVRDHLERFGKHYDAVVIFRFNSAVDHLETIRELAPKAKIIYHTSDLHFLREERASKVNNKKIPERRHTFAKTKQSELGIVRSSDVTVLHSHYEKELLADLVPGSPVVVFPWIYQPRGGGLPASDRRDLVFLGGYRHYPNVDAVTYFARDILPLLKSGNPDIVFHAIGSDPAPEMEALAGENLKIMGFVPDVSPALWRARMMVAPLRYGAGLKGKIVTALAHGLPVVTTTIGAEGMGLTEGVDVIVADEPLKMAAAIERLSSDDSLWNELSKAGLDYVARTTSREVGSAIVARILETVGLPTVARSPYPLGSSHSFLGAFGSPQALHHPRTLLAAAGVQPDDTGLLLVSNALAGLAVDGWQVRTIEEARGPSARVVAIVDGTSDDEVMTLAARLPVLVSRGGSASVLFAPPRVVLENGTYCVMRPFVDKNAPEPIRPPHLQHAAALAVLGGELSWQVDSQAVGFPSLMRADWSK